MASGESKQKQAALAKLNELHSYLDETLPPPDEVRRRVRKLVAESKETGRNKHFAFPEGAFLNRFAAPALGAFLRERCGFSASSSRQSLLSESHGGIPEIASGSPKRRQPHPFTKAIIRDKVANVVGQWKGNRIGRSPVTRDYPDLTLRAPFPYPTVIEGKYFPKGGVQPAESELVKCIFEAFFYRGLVKLQATRTHAAWDYDYACLLAYDATPTGSLQEAWQGFKCEVRAGFWEGASVYVMIVPASRELRRTS